MNQAGICRRFGSHPWAAVAVCALATFTASPAHATPTVFAQFSATSGSPFAFTYQSGPNTATLTGSATVQFEYVNMPGNPLNNVIQPATLTISVTATANATQGFGFVDQPIASSSSFSIIAGGVNLLSGTSISGNITGKVGGVNANLSGSTSSGDTVVFSSDLLSFSNVSLSSFSFIFPDVNPTLALSTHGTSTFLSNFSSDTQGAFTTDPAPAVPEPSSIGLIAAGVALTSLATFRKKSGGVAD